MSVRGDNTQDPGGYLSFQVVCASHMFNVLLKRT